MGIIFRNNFYPSLKTCYFQYISHKNSDEIYKTYSNASVVFKRFKNNETTKHKFIDKVVLDVCGGKGGNGCVRWVNLKIVLILTKETANYIFALFFYITAILSEVLVPKNQLVVMEAKVEMSLLLLTKI